MYIPVCNNSMAWGIHNYCVNLILQLHCVMTSVIQQTYCVLLLLLLLLLYYVTLK
jgi:hypothetical protein